MTTEQILNAARYALDAGWIAAGGFALSVIVYEVCRFLEGNNNDDA